MQEILYIPLRSTWCDAVVNRRRQWSCQECMRFREPAWLSIDDNSVTNNCNCKMIRPFCGAPPPEKENKKGKRTYPFTHPCSVRVSERRWKCEQKLFRDVQAGSGPHVIPSFGQGQTKEFRGPVNLGVERAAPRTSQPTTTTTLCSKKKQETQ